MTRREEMPATRNRLIPLNRWRFVLDFLHYPARTGCRLLALAVTVAFVGGPLHSLADGVSINLRQTRQKVEVMGVDMERSANFLLHASNPGDVVKWYFEDTVAGICRVKYDKHQEIVEGAPDWMYYDDQVTSMQMILATNPAIEFFAVLRSDYMGFNMGDTNNWPVWIYHPTVPGANQPQNFESEKYGCFLADYVMHMASNGVPITYLNTGKETKGIVTAEHSKTTVDVMNAILDSNGVTRPLIVGPGTWGVPSGTSFVQETINNGWDDRYHAFCTHNLGGLDASAWQSFSDVSHSIGKQAWDSESSSMAGGRTSGVEPPITNQIPQLMRKLDAYRGGINGEIFFEAWSRGINSETRSIYFRNGQPATRMRSYYLNKELINTLYGRAYVEESITGTSGLDAVAFRSDTNVVIWAINNSSAAQVLAPFTFLGGTIEGPVDMRFWSSATPIQGISGQLQTVSDNQFVVNMLPYSIYRFHAAISHTETNLVGFWPMTEQQGSVVTDFSGSEHDGALVNSPAWTTNAAGRTHLQFDGNSQYVAVAGMPNLNQSLTAACWARSDAATWNNYGVLISKRPQFVLHPWTGPAKQLSFIVFDTNNVQRRADFDLVDIDGFDLTEWHHYAGSYDAVTGEARLFVDGIARASTNIGPGVLKSDSGSLTLGRDDSMSRYLTGSLDEVQLYDRALFESEIDQLTAGFDDDLDGLPDEFERALIEYSNTDSVQTLADVTPEGDFDLDSMSNGDELVAGTDAASAEDRLELTLSRTATDVVVSAQGKTGRTYTFESTASPLGGAWQPELVLGPLTFDQKIAFTNSPSPPGGGTFLRVRVQ